MSLFCLRIVNSEKKLLIGFLYSSILYAYPCCNKHSRSLIRLFFLPTIKRIPVLICDLFLFPESDIKPKYISWMRALLANLYHNRKNMSAQHRYKYIHVDLFSLYIIFMNNACWFKKVKLLRYVYLCNPLVSKHSG